VSTSFILRDLISELARKGKIVLFSSHELETVERVCSSVVILQKGKVVANDSIRNLSEILALPNLEGIFSQLAIEQDTAAITREIVEVIES
jgi:ABC-2 type transport system ATP-binding protein